MDQQSDEQFVRSRWGWVQVRTAEPYEGIPQGKWSVRIPLLPFSQIGFPSEVEAWSAAAAFTREREEQIRQVEEEIALVGGIGHMAPCECCGVRDRILAREQAALAELKKGMKP